MQQAYRVLRIVAEAQMIRIVLASQPSELMLEELCVACGALRSESSTGVKAIMLEFSANVQGSQSEPEESQTLNHVAERAAAAVRAITQPVLAVVRSTLSEEASCLMRAADIVLLVATAQVWLPLTPESAEYQRLPGTHAARLGYAECAANEAELDVKLEALLKQLRDQSAIALRHVKAGVNLAQQRINAGGVGHLRLVTSSILHEAELETDPQIAAQARQSAAHLEALKRVNAFYLTEVMKTADAHEGLRAFLEKRRPKWKHS